MATISEQENLEIDEAINSGEASPVKPLVGRSLFSAQAQTVISGEDPNAFLQQPVSAEPVVNDLNAFVRTPISESTNLQRAKHDQLRRRAKLVAIFNNDIDNLSNYVSQLESGDTSALDDMVNSIRAANEADTQNKLLQIVNDPELTEQEKVFRVLEMGQKSDAVNLDVAASVGLAETQTGSSGQIRSQQQDILETLRERKEQNITDFAVHASRNSYTSDGRLGTDLAVAMLAPGAWAPQVFEVLNKVFPEIVTDQDIGGAGVPGKIIQDYKTHIKDLWEVDREKAKNKILELAEAINDNTFLDKDNDAVKWMLSQSLLYDIDNGSTFERVLEDIFGVLDLTIYGSAVIAGKAFLKGVKEGVTGAAEKAWDAYADLIFNANHHKTPGSVSDKLDKAAPEQSGAVHADVLNSENPQEAAEMLDELYENIIDSHIAIRVDGTDIMGVPDLTESATIRIGQSRRTSLMSESDLKVAAERISDAAAQRLGIRGELHLNKSVIRDTGDGIELEAVYGKTKDIGWESPELVQIMADDLPDQVKINPIILVRDKADDVLKPMNEVPAERRAKDYYLQATQRDKVIPGDSVPRRVTLERGLSGHWAKFFDKSSYLTRIARYSENIADDATANMHRALNDLLLPYSKLKSRQRSLVTDALDDGDAAGEFFKPYDLRKRWGNRRDQASLIKAYYSVVAHNRVARELINDAVVRSLKTRGFKEATIKGLNEGSPTLVNIRDSIPDTITRVYDPKTDSVIELSQQKIQELTQQGGAFLELSRAALKSIEGEDPVKVKYALAEGADLAEVREQFLPDVDGYITRLYDAHYKVVELVPAVDQTGQFNQFEKVIHMARTEQEARRAVKKLSAENPDKVYVDQRLSELDRESRMDDILTTDMFVNSGEIFFGKRGPEILDVDGNRIVKPINERIDAMTRAASRATHLDFLVEKSMGDWLRLYPEFAQNGSIPFWSRNFLPENSTRLQRRRYKQAIAHRDRILILAGLNPSRMRAMWEEAAINVAEHVGGWKLFGDESRRAEGLSKWILDHRSGGVIDGLKQVAFLDWIVMAPQRQLFLQAQQASLYVGEKYATRYLFGSPKGAQEFYGLWRGMMSRDSEKWDTLAPTLAKQSGMSVKEYTEFVDTIRNSGMFANIDSHALTDGMSQTLLEGGKDSAFRAALQNTKRPIKLAAKVIRKAGFDAGEAFQLSLSILIQRNKWIQENPTKAHLWNKGENYREIFGRARALSGNMTNSGLLGFQRTQGLSLAMQFQSHNWKMRQVMIPQTLPLPKSFKRRYEKSIGKLANKEWSDKQRLILAAQQTLMYGPAGFLGLQAYYDKKKTEMRWDELRARNPELWDIADQAVREGLAGTAINAMVNVADEGEWYQAAVDFSGNMAPLSGIATVPASRLFEAQALGVVDFGQLPFVSTLGKVGTALGTISALLGARFADEARDAGTGLPEDTTLALSVLESGLSIASGFDNIQRARLGDALQMVMSRSGNARVKAGAAEIWAQIFGAESTEARRVSAHLEAVKDRYTLASEAAFGKEDRHAQWLYDTAVRIVQDRLLAVTEDGVPSFTSDESIRPYEQSVNDTIAHLMELTRLMYYNDPEGFAYIKDQALPAIMDSHWLKEKYSTDDVPTQKSSLIGTLDTLVGKQVPNLDKEIERVKLLEPDQELNNLLELWKDI